MTTATPERTLNVIEKIRWNLGLARQQMLALIEAGFRSHLLTASDAELEGQFPQYIERARAIETSWNIWVGIVRDAIAEQRAVDAWELGHILGISGWQVARFRAQGWLGPSLIEPRGQNMRPTYLYTPTDWDDFVKANAESLIEGRRSGPLATPFLAWLDKTLDKS